MTEWDDSSFEPESSDAVAERLNSDKFFSTSGATDLLNWLSSMLKRIWMIRHAVVIVPVKPKRYFRVRAPGESKASVIVRFVGCL